VRFEADALRGISGSNSLLMKRTAAPENPGRILAMLFNNFWYTNFPGNSHGVMEFRFDLWWRNPQALPDKTPPADALVLISPARKEEPLYLQWLYKP
jgi:hypothetical protein